MKVTIQAGVYTYRIASRAISEDGVGCFEKRLLNELSLVDSFGAAGTAPLSLSINIRNNDWFIPAAVDLWAATVVVEADNGHKWTGKVTNYDSDGEGVLYVIATEKTAPELSIQIPDEVARVVSLDENFHVSAINVTLPYVLGGNVANPILVKGILIDKTQGIYLLAVGENRQFVKVYRGTEELTSGFSAFTGTAGQTNYPGICYVQITDESLRKNDDGSYVEISADIVGLKLGSHTIEECRNGARQLLWLLKTAKDGVGGWGLGISESEINLDAFAESISRVDAAGLKSDGIMYFRQEAIGYIDQICKAIRGRYRINADGKRSLFVDAPASSVKTYSPTLKNMKLLRFGKGAYTGRVFNKGRLEFGYNPLTGLFMQTVSYQNSASISAIDEQEFLGQSYFLRDMASAQAILDYTCKKSLTGAEKVYFETLELPENASGGQIITVDHPERGVSGNYQITHMNVTDFVHVIEAERFSSDDFISGTPGAAINWMKDPPVVSPVVPGVPSDLVLASEVRPSPDGTNIVVIKGSFTPPAGSYIAASIEWGEGILPILSWNDRGMMQGSQFEIAPVKPAQAYAVRIRMVTSTGKSTYITGTVTTEGDTVPPGKPSISATSSLKNVSINLSLATVPSDMAGFQIFRNTTNDSATATQIGYVESTKGIAQTVDINTEYGSSYYYWAKAVDTWGNPSVFSDAFGPLTISMILNHDVSPEAIKQAIGSVASWSAKNCTTASIAEVNGVKDVSGNGNHGQAFGGVAIVDTEMGKAFSFDGINDYCLTNSLNYVGATEFSFACFAKKTSYKQYSSFYSDYSASHRNVLCGYQPSNGSISFYIGSAGSSISLTAIGIFADDEWAHWAFIFKGSEYMRIYKNGALVAERTFSVPAFVGATHNDRYIGRYSTLYFAGQIFDSRVYSRALSATEVKSIYMFPGDVAFGRITGDLVTTGELITLSAQIAKAIINDAHIDNLNAAKLTAGFIDVLRIAFDSLDGRHLKSKSIETRNLSVLAENYVNPVSQTGTLNGWGNIQEDGSGTSTLITYDAAEKALRIRNNASFAICSQTFLVDPNKIYRISGKIKKSANNGRYYFGLSGFSASQSAKDGAAGGTLAGNLSFAGWNTNRNAVSATANFYFFGINEAPTDYHEFTYFLLGANRNINECPNYYKPLGSTPDAPYAKCTDTTPFHCAIRILNWLNTATTDLFIKDISVSEVGGGEIIAENVKTGKLTSTNYAYTSGNFSNAGTEIDLNTGLIRSKKFGIDTNGNAFFSGDITGASGAFAGELSSGLFAINPADGEIDISSYTGRLSIDIASTTGVSGWGLHYYPRIVLRIGTLLLEVGGHAVAYSSSSSWNSVYARVLSHQEVDASRTVVRFVRNLTTNRFVIMLGETTTNWAWMGRAKVIERENCTGIIIKASTSGTTDSTIYAQRHMGTIVAWLLFDGTGTYGTITNSRGISSVNKNGTGDYTIFFSTTLPSANYAVLFGLQAYATNNCTVRAGIAAGAGTPGAVITKTTSALRVTIGHTMSVTAYDLPNLSVAIILP